MSGHITVSIPGKAWRSQPFTDPHYKTDAEDIYKLVTGAKIVPRGKGESVILSGPVDALLHLAEWFENDAYAWSFNDEPEARADIRALYSAAEKIRAACDEANK